MIYTKYNTKYNIIIYDIYKFINYLKGVICHNCLQTGLYVFYTMVTQKYAIKSHLISLLSSRNHSTIQISVCCKNCENTIR